MHPALKAKFRVTSSDIYTEGTAMLAWQKTPLEWYALPRSERAFMKAIGTAKNLIEAMLTWDMREDAKREAKLEADRERRRHR